MAGYKKEARTMVSPVSKDSGVDNIMSDNEMDEGKGKRFAMTFTNRLRKWLRMAFR